MDDERMREVLRELEHWEGREPRLYLCSRGHPTIGVGCLVDETAFVALPLRTDGGRLATSEQKRAEFARVSAMHAGLTPTAYHAQPPAPRLCLTDEAIDGLAFRRLHTALAGMRRLCPGFDGFPVSAQACLVDLAWNLGTSTAKPGLGSWAKLLSACNRGDWRTAAIESHVSSSRDARNEWRAKMFFEAAVRVA